MRRALPIYKKAFTLTYIYVNVISLEKWNQSSTFSDAYSQNTVGLTVTQRLGVTARGRSPGLRECAASLVI